MDEAVIRRKIDIALSEILRHGYHSAPQYIEGSVAEFEREISTVYERNVLNQAVLETYYRALLADGAQKCDLFDRFRTICASGFFSSEEISNKIKYALNLDFVRDDEDSGLIEQRLLLIQSSFSDYEQR